MSEYWKEYWNKIPIDIDKQSQVGRTQKKQPISSELFMKTLDWVKEKLQINNDSVILELCCGNGCFTIPYSNLVKHITAVDISVSLLNILRNELINNGINNVDIKHEDVAVIDAKNYSRLYTHIFIYFAIQHFSETEVIQLFATSRDILKRGGIFYIGDIPDREKLWEFANTKEYTKMYFDSIKNNTPAVGTWFMKNDLIKLAEYVGFAKCEIIEQPAWQINSKYRFDVKLLG